MQSARRSAQSTPTGMQVTIAEPMPLSQSAPRCFAGEDATVHPARNMQPLLKLMTFLSPAFPAGSFAYSHGLEWVIDGGGLADAAALQAWIADLLAVGSLWNDAVLFAEAYRCASADDMAGLDAAVRLGEALAGCAERWLETMAQGRAFLDSATAWPCRPGERLASTGAPYPVAVAAVAAAHAIALENALPAYLNAAAVSLVSVAVRLVPLGQAAGLRVQAALHPLIQAAAARASASALDDLGSATMMSDIAAMRHETQHSRIFRT